MQRKHTYALATPRKYASTYLSLQLHVELHERKCQGCVDLTGRLFWRISPLPNIIFTGL